MASGPSQLHQPGTCNGAFPAAPPGSGPEDGERQLHIQMCKKIAQLTKVIYALNMKNDEHEASIQALKEAHQEEIQNILAETKEAALHYKRKVEKEQELQQRIQSLEAALEQRRPSKEEVLTEFTTFRKQEGEREPPAESEHAKEDISLPKDMVHMKLDSKNRVQTSNQESDSLLNEQEPFEGEKLGIKKNFSEKDIMEMWTLIRETEALKRENQKLAEEYAEKACQLQASHERDRETWRKAMQQSLADSCQDWQQKEMAQRGNFEAQEAALQQQIKKLEADLETKGQCISKLKKHSQKLKETIQDLELQLKEAHQVATESKRTMRTLEEELTIAKERILVQENEILQKMEAVGKVLHPQSKARGEGGDLKSQILHFQQVLSSKRSPGGKDLKEVQAQLEEMKKKHENEIRKLKREKDTMHGKLQGHSQESPDASVNLKNNAKQYKGRTKEHSAARSSTRSEEKRSEMNATASRSDSGNALKREDEQSLASFQKERAKEMQALQEGWSYQKAELQAQVAQLKETLEQRANSFQEALHEQNQQSGKEKEKFLQKLQDTAKQSQDIKAQQETSHQTAINLLEKSKNQELKEAKEHLKKDSHESFKVQQESDRQEVQALEEKAREDLENELEKRRQQQSLLIESLRVELAEQRTSCIIHKKEKDELQEELRNAMVLKRQQDESNHNQIQSLKDEVVRCQNEIRGLKKENALLKDTVDLLRADVTLQKQTSGQLQEPEGQHGRFKELEETAKRREPRPEDLHLISCLQEKLNEKEEMIKELMDGRKLQPPFVPHRTRSFSLNMNPATCLAPIAKQKKKMDDMPSRIVSVPNLASYAKSFLSGDLRPKRNPPQITKSTSLDQNPGCVRVCYPPAQVLETKVDARLRSNEMAKPKDAQKLDPQPQEWFTKYFSF